MKLLVFSHKEVWKSNNSPTGWATDGGFVYHMMALGSMFDHIEIFVPEVHQKSDGEVFFSDQNVTIVPIWLPQGISGWRRKLFVIFWAIVRFSYLIRKIKSSNVVHVPIPSDFGTIGMIITKWLQKPLFIRYCGNWYTTSTLAEKFWKNFMIKHSGNKVLGMATGGGPNPPSTINPNIKWIFSSSLLENELDILEIRAKQTLKDDIFRIATVSRQVVKKGTANTLRSIKELDNEQIEFSVVGDGPDLDNFKTLAEELGISNQVVFYGNLNHNDVIEILLKSDVFCFPTQSSEGFPKVILEAMACGLPVITNPVSVLPELIGKSESGVILKDGIPEEISHEIQILMSNHEIRSNYADNALRTAKKYSLEQWTDEIAKEFNQTFGIILQRKRALVK